MRDLTRRDCLKVVAATMASVAVPLRILAKPPDTVKAVAAVFTVYRSKSHTDVLIGKILEGWKQDGGAGPALKLVSMYADQFPKDDLARNISKKFGTISPKNHLSLRQY